MGCNSFRLFLIFCEPRFRVTSTIAHSSVFIGNDGEALVHLVRLRPRPVDERLPVGHTSDRVQCGRILPSHTLRAEVLHYDVVLFYHFSIGISMDHLLSSRTEWT